MKTIKKIFLALKRTIKQSFLNFWRNGWLSIAAVSVLILSLYVVGAIFVLSMTTNNVLKNIEEKINVSVYFKTEVSEDRIFEIKKEMEGFSEVKSIDYISKEKALEDFKRNNADEPVIMQSLEEIGENPLLSSLIIRANRADQYQIISDYITNRAEFKNDISRMNYNKNRDRINNLNDSFKKIKKIGLVLAIIFAVVSILIIFNTIRITIYTYKQEIEVERLVGSSNMFIRLPFIFEGIIYGLIAALFASALLFITIKFINPHVSSIVVLGDLYGFYKSKILLILGIQAGTGVLLGILSSWIAIRKYLKV